MNSLKTLAAAALLSTTAFGGALAADAIGMPPPVVSEVPVFDRGGFDWNGFYAGVRAGGQHRITQGETDWTVGGQIGVNAAFDFFVLGAELGVDAVFDDADIYAYGEILGRGGVIVTDELLAYAAIGYGSDFGAAAGAGSHILAGGGLEFAVTNDVTVRGQYLYGFEQTGAADTSDIHKFSLGANFHF